MVGGGVLARCIDRRRFSISDTDHLASARTFAHNGARAVCGENVLFGEIREAIFPELRERSRPLADVWHAR